MNEQVSNVMFALIRRVVCGGEGKDESLSSITPDLLAQLYTLSKSHDMAHIVAQGLSDVGILGEDEVSQKFQKQLMVSFFRYQQLHYESEQISQALEDAGIPFLPLKGAVIRRCYPEPWMRTSCDIDVLVHEEDLETAVSHLSSQLQYRVEGKKNYHDISLYSPSGVHLELHFNIRECMEKLDPLLDTVWEHATPAEENSCIFSLSPEFLLFHTVAHASYHFVSGGCGIRPFLDLWLMRKTMAYDEEKLLSLCDQAGVTVFYQAMCRLSEVWFSSADSSSLTVQMSDYLLKAGVYGSMENQVTVQTSQKGGTVRFLLSRIFVSYDHLVLIYPSLKKCPPLLPFYQVARWFRLLKGSKAKKALREWSISNSLSSSNKEGTATLLKQLGL